MLQTCGEHGYRNLTVQRVLDRYGGNRAQFYGEFPNLEACYLEAYETEGGRVCAAVLQAGAAAPTWREGLRAALDALASYACEQPLPARALLVDVHCAGEAALCKRKEMLERLCRALDSARRENRFRHSPPPLTALFMVSAIETALVTALAAGEPQRFQRVVPELVALVCTAYFGEEPA